MTPPADPREALRALVALGEKATPGEWHETHGEIECDQCGEQAYLCDVTSHAEDDTPYLSLAMQFVGLESLARPNADFIVAAANARPALAAIERKVWLDVEDAKLAESALISMGARWEFDPEGALPVAAKAAYEAADRLAREVAALAAAEAELRARADARRHRPPPGGEG